MKPDYDVCIVGSGAGAGPIAFELSKAGYKVLVLEKGPWLKEPDFTKDEIACCRRDTYTPELKDEPQVIEDKKGDSWIATSNLKLDWSFWNGNMVGGSSNLMSGYFHRMKPVDFQLASEFGNIEGANIVDWPISYNDMEPYFDKVEKIVGVSGNVVNHPHQEPRSEPDFPYPPTREHIMSSLIDKAGEKLQYSPFPMPRAILSKSTKERSQCIYTGYCGSYGCTTKAKGSSRAALLDPAIKTGNCEIWPNSRVYRLESNKSGEVTKVRFFNKQGEKQQVTAKIYVVACQAVETSRLLLLSTGPKHPNGLGNNNNQVGKNLLFSAGGLGGADFIKNDFNEIDFMAMKEQGTFVNRALQDWYTIHDHPDFNYPIKGGTIDFLLGHSNPIRRAIKQKRENGKLIWGKQLKDKLEYSFHNTQRLEFEVFCDWLPTDNCFVSLDESVKDKWGIPVAKIRIGNHPHDLKVGEYLAGKAEALLKAMGGKNVYSRISGSPPANLMAGGCRFGKEPKNSVLDPDCRIHDAPNVYISDGSFMPTGGSVTYTWSIYANSFRVADKIKSALDEERK
jgi:choline dehydrogenase-like flavoprotein